MTPREWALTVELSYCRGACAGDALLCAPHGRIEKAVAQAVEDATRAASKWTA